MARTAVYSSYDSLGGYSLKDNELALAKNVSSPALPRVSSESALNVNLDTHTVATFAQVGVTDSFDLGVIVPWVKVDLAADGLYLDASGTTQGSLSVPRAKAWGVGDMGIFGKVLLWRQPDGGDRGDLRRPPSDRRRGRFLARPRPHPARRTENASAAPYPNPRHTVARSPRWPHQQTRQQTPGLNHLPMRQ